MSNNRSLSKMDHAQLVELGEEFYQRTAQILEKLLSGDDVDDPLLELDDKWFEHLREEDQRLRREGFEEDSAPAEDNGELSIATSPTAFTAMQSFLIELLIDLKNLEEIMIDSQEADQFDETGARSRDLEEHDEIIISTTTDGDECDDDDDEEVIAAGATDGDGHDFDDDEELITTGTTTDGDEFNDAEGEQDQESLQE